MQTIRRPRKGDRHPRTYLQRLAAAVGIVSVMLGTLLSFSVATSSASVAVNTSGFGTDPGNTFTGQSSLNVQCPNGIAGTPGSDPADKVLNTALNTQASFQHDGTVHYIYNDNPNFSSGNFDLQDCIVVYPVGYFTASDLDPVTGIVTNTSKNKLDKSGTELDGATLSAIHDSTHKIFFNWTPAAGAVTPGQWVCNFARDIATGHGGGGNRKVTPTCFEVKDPVTPAAPTQNASQTCNVVDTYTVPATSNASYQIGGVTKQAGTYPLPEAVSVTITAVAADGYYFPTGTTTSWTFTGGPVSTCETPPTAVTPKVPWYHVAGVCGTQDTYELPQTIGVTYLVNGTPMVSGVYKNAAGSVITITAVAQTGYVLAEGAPASWGPFTGADTGNCPLGVSPADPTHTINTSCGVVDTYTIPNTTGVVYEIGGEPVAAGTYDLPAGTSVSITAIPAQGYVFSEGAQSEWPTFTGSVIETCPTTPTTIVVVNPTTTTTVAPTTTTTTPELALTPEPEVSPISAVAPTTTTAAPTPTTAAPGPVLAFTGGNTMTNLLVAFGLLGLGGLLLAISRRRQQES